MVLKATKDDQAITGRLDLVTEYLELVTEAKRRDLTFDQPFAGLRECALRLANADRERAALGLASLDKKFAEEMRFSRAAAAVYAFIARRCKQRFENLSCRYFQDGQWYALFYGSVQARRHRSAAVAPPCPSRARE